MKELREQIKKSIRKLEAMPLPPGIENVYRAGLLNGLRISLEKLKELDDD